MTDTDGSPRSTKELLLLVLWGFLPAIFLAASAVRWVGVGTDNSTSAVALGYMGRLFVSIGVVGMPFILYPWSKFFLQKMGDDPERPFWPAVYLTLVMCVANLTIGIAGCSAIGAIFFRI